MNVQKHTVIINVIYKSVYAWTLHLMALIIINDTGLCELFTCHVFMYV